MDQNRALWDYLLIRRGFAALERIERLGGMTGPYAIQAPSPLVMPERPLRRDRLDSHLRVI